jgi:hypothetical protein
MVRARDAVIGVLYQGETAGETAREVYRTAREFFAALRAGEELEQFLHPAVREVLAMRLRREASGREISKLRYSRVEREQEEARMRVRLFGEPGRSAGELLLQRENGEWYLSAVDIDFFALEREYEPPERQASGRVGESPLNFY